jgi:propionyl-CoA carboxylase alpha chain
VEHPVTEAVTGLDLVELQLLVAAGEPLPIAQDDVTVSGHAIEVRVVAEDPAAGWMPSTGTIDRFTMGDGVRVDTGVRDGSAISSDYDSLVAKVIAHAPTRTRPPAGWPGRCGRRSSRGSARNLDTLVAILGEADYLAAATPTAYLDEHPDVLAAIRPTGDDRIALLLGAVFALEFEHRSADRVTRSRRRAGATCARKGSGRCGSIPAASTCTSSTRWQTRGSRAAASCTRRPSGSGRGRIPTPSPAPSMPTNARF